MSQVKARLESLGITLPAAATPVANYVSYTRTGNIVNISGQISVDANGGIKGTVGVDVSLEDGVKAARICGLNLLAQMQAACDGDLDNVVRVLKLNAFVQAGPDFYDIPKVINGCSDLMVEVLGEAGKHARSAVGMYKIPLGFAVEIDAQIEVKDRR
ncbi:RidA family protein [Asticcacaulis sp. ZE23SCel15]|jgi:enamine deaminase RidA (YjgF/YER057c/UK114 family)|uniref:RidA family protein n=1 Tax=Asticcacaulis sp. ZE23SCel15 TaxID=3059027 RepID=UPI00265E6E89|nr:RidA family protein [Asticcacaulis sp. ZE23SCel15]WKL57301.1 RidA family protein [Asticcacaulis sp. ZE23SCel15]